METLIIHRVILPEQVEIVGDYALVPDPMPAPVFLADYHSQTADRTIKGKTTFHEMLDWGVSQGFIEHIIGEPIPVSQRIVKEYCDEKGLDFEVIKIALEEEANQSGNNH